MVVKMRSNMNEIFVQALYTEDMPLLRTIVEGLKYVRVNHLNSMLVAKAELGGFTPFEFACLHGNATLASMLIDTGKIDINRIGQCGWTPLHAASYSGDVNTVRVLVNSCADCFARDENNNLPLDLCKDENTRSLLLSVMRQKNLTKFNEIINEHEERLSKKQGHRHQQRSKSCFANVSAIKMNELKTQLIERKQSLWEFNMEGNKNIENQLRRWKTCSDLTMEVENLLEMTC
ncbi:protein phosphatase 1 regulatory inhibitor subunit 16B-like [Clytia hemisphaerica]|uniref:Uncharacterized protein n=1 Tax=Clytia hemisphaerica TaxID=252671 RepID=A0A7M5WWG4_9CNID